MKITLLAPGGLTALAASSSSITLSWTDTSSGETGSQIWRSPNGSSSWTWLTTTAPNATSFDDWGLTASTTYYYRVCATSGTDDSGLVEHGGRHDAGSRAGRRLAHDIRGGKLPVTYSSSWLEVYNYTTEAAQLSQFQLRTYARTKNAWTFSDIVTFDLPSLLVQPGQLCPDPGQELGHVRERDEGGLHRQWFHAGAQLEE